MWIALAVVSTFAGLMALLWRSARKGRRKADKDVGRLSHALDAASTAIGELQDEIKTIESHANDALDAKQRQLTGYFDTLTEAIDSAASPDALRDLVNADARRMLDVPWSTPANSRDQAAVVSDADATRAETVDGSGRVPR